MLGVGELGDARCLDVTPIEHFIQVHFGNPACGVAGVVVALGVNHETVQHALHLDFNFVQQQCQLTRLHEGRDVVIGIEALSRGQQAFTYLHGNRGSRKGVR